MGMSSASINKPISRFYALMVKELYLEMARRLTGKGVTGSQLVSVGKVWGGVNCHGRSQGELGAYYSPKIGRALKTETNQETGTKRHLRPLDAFAGHLQCIRNALRSGLPWPTEGA